MHCLRFLLKSKQLVVRCFFRSFNCCCLFYSKCFSTVAVNHVLVLVDSSASFKAMLSFFGDDFLKSCAGVSGEAGYCQYMSGCFCWHILCSDRISGVDWLRQAIKNKKIHRFSTTLFLVDALILTAKEDRFKSEVAMRKNIVRNVLDCVKSLGCIQLVVSGCDHLFGFKDFFYALDRDFSHKIVGVDYCNSDVSDKEFFSKELMSWLDQLASCQYRLVMFSDDPVICQRIVCFLSIFKVFLLRFCYFVSCVVVSEEKCRGGLVCFLGESSYLSNKLFNNNYVSLFYARSKGKVRGFRLNRRRRFFCGAVYLLCVLFLLFFGRLLMHEKAYAVAFQQRVVKLDEKLSQVVLYPDALVNYHESLVEIYQQYQFFLKGIPNVFMRNARIDQGMIVFRDNFLKVLNYFVWWDVIDQMKNKLQFYHHQWKLFPEQRDHIRGQYYHYLKSYVMLWLPDHVSIDVLRGVFSNMWLEKMPSFDGGRRSSHVYHKIDVMMEFYLKKGLINKIDRGSFIHPGVDEMNLIKEARKDLFIDDNFKNVFYEKIDQNNRLISLNDLLKVNTPSIFLNKGEIPYIYTESGWINVVHPLLLSMKKHHDSEAWVFGMTDDEGSMGFNDNINLLLTAYQKNYQAAWINLMSQVRLLGSSSFSDYLSDFQRIFRVDSNFLRFVSVCYRNLNIHFSLHNQMVKKIDAIHSNKKQKKSLFNSFVVNYQQIGYAVQDDLQKIESSSDVEKSAFDFAGDVFSDNTVPSLEKAALLVDNFVDRQPRSFQSAWRYVLLLPIRSAWSHVLYSSSEFINAQWKNKVYSAYQLTLKNYFPFSVSSVDSIAPGVISDWLKPAAGNVFVFYRDYLKNFIKKESGVLTLRKWLDVSLSLSLSSLNQIEWLLSFGDQLTPVQGLKFSYQLRPVADHRVESILIKLGNNKFVYNNGPIRNYSFVYQSLVNGEHSSYVRVRLLNGKVFRSKEFYSLYSGFRLWQHANWHKVSSEKYQLCWNFSHSNVCEAKVYLKGLAADFLYQWYKKGIVFPPDLMVVDLHGVE